jgi:hypothetical protein
LGESQDRPESLHGGYIVAREMWTRNDHHARDLEYKISHIVECSEKRVSLESAR